MTRSRKASRSTSSRRRRLHPATPRTTTLGQVLRPEPVPGTWFEEPGINRAAAGQIVDPRPVAAADLTSDEREAVSFGAAIAFAQAVHGRHDSHASRTRVGYWLRRYGEAMRGAAWPMQVFDHLGIPWRGDAQDDALTRLLGLGAEPLYVSPEDCDRLAARHGVSGDDLWNAVAGAMTANIRVFAGADLAAFVEGTTPALTADGRLLWFADLNTT